jgi:hypothetical protein
MREAQNPTYLDQFVFYFIDPQQSRRGDPFPFDGHFSGNAFVIFSPTMAASRK